MPCSMAKPPTIRCSSNIALTSEYRADLTGTVEGRVGGLLNGANKFGVATISPADRRHPLLKSRCGMAIQGDLGRNRNHCLVMKGCITRLRSTLV